MNQDGMTPRNPVWHIHAHFKSNERPWSTDYRYDWADQTRYAAILWARGMRDNLPGYEITLYEDGVFVDIDSEHINGVI